MWKTVFAAAFITVALVGLYVARRKRRPPRALESNEVRLFRVRAPSGAPDRQAGIASGDLRSVRSADVWVNSENTMMRMARVEEFSVSSIIRYEGSIRDEFGAVIQDVVADELTRKVSGRSPVPPATAIVTGAGELRHNGVRRIVHVAAVHGEPGAGFRQIHEVGRCVTAVLREIDRLGDDLRLRTVLFPLLGVGQGSGALEPTIKALVNAAIDYFSANPRTKVTTVLFLAYTDVERTWCKRIFAGHPRLRAIPAPAPDTVGDDAGMLPGTPGPAPASFPDIRRKLQVGIVIDVVGFGRRTAPAQEAIQRRLAALAAAAVAVTGLALDRLDHQWTGDGVIVFLPSDSDPTSAIPGLVQEMAHALAVDNARHDDRIRLRMAVGVGITAPGATGFGGPMVIDISRLVDSAPLRGAVDAVPDADLLILLSEHVHGYLVQPGYLRPRDLRAVRVAVKEFEQRAWLWIPQQQPR